MYQFDLAGTSSFSSSVSCCISETELPARGVWERQAQQDLQKSQSCPYSRHRETKANLMFDLSHRVLLSLNNYLKAPSNQHFGSLTDKFLVDKVPQAALWCARGISTIWAWAAVGFTDGDAKPIVQLVSDIVGIMRRWGGTGLSIFLHQFDKFKMCKNCEGKHVTWIWWSIWDSIEYLSLTEANICKLGSIYYFEICF